jgi:predicted RNA binding protein YcfA (HicA-like mRNA interferase family)
MPSPIRFAEIRKQLEAAGYRLVRISSSHHIFDRPGGPLVSIPVHNDMVKAGYGRRIQKIIAADNERKAREPGRQPGESGQPGKGD